jgi:ATPase subunit of ABC transporter with duplicated ATPase domains
MSVLLSCRRLGHGAGTKTLFQDLSFSVNKGDKIGLNGHNGCGKSTLLKLLAGDIQPDDGEINRRGGLRLGVVEQFLPEGLAGLDLERAVLERIPAADRDELAYRAAVTLTNLGFQDPQFALAVSDLSGGQLNRLMLARALVNDPDLVLFDEPSNHMDLATLAMLERYLADEIACAFVLVSHDRALLDGVTNRPLILRDERTYAFDLPYSAARQALTEMDIAAAATRADEEKKIAGLRASAKRLAIWGKVYDNEKLARKAKTMEKRVARMEQAKTFVTRGSGLALTLDSSGSRSNRMLRLGDLTVTPPGAPDVPLFHIDEVVIRPGDRVALLGHNGCGKTSLLTLIVNAFQTEGDEHILFSPQARIGYYDQELNEVETDGVAQTMLEFLRKKTQAQETSIRNGLINAGFAYLDHDRRISVLSGGERARLMFLRLRLNRPNFLIMDEPTNHIDIDGKEELEAQLSESGATLLMTSHDRRFIDNVATRFLLVTDGGLREIHDPEMFYASVAGEEIPVAAEDEVATQPGEHSMLSEESLLERIVELETLIGEDEARKSKFQKPKLQSAWKQELVELNKRLEDSA